MSGKRKRKQNKPRASRSFMASDPPQNCIWVLSDRTLDGTYVMSIGYGEDLTFAPADPARYTRSVLQAAEYASYDAAVARQMRAILPERGPGSGLTRDDAMALVVRDLRADRAPVDNTATKPLSFIPGVNSSLKPFLTICRDGEPFAQWDVAGAREHALYVLRASITADLDGAYRRLLVSQVELEPDQAAQVVGHLGEHRD